MSIRPISIAAMKAPHRADATDDDDDKSEMMMFSPMPI